ncbi:MAG: DUF2171 domain-containing protein [Thermomicrobiales bacterium]
MTDTTPEPSTPSDWTVREGTPVITFDGEKIGEVENATGGHLLVKKGFLFPKEYAIPAAAIQNVGPDAVYLKVTREIALSQGWDEPLSPDADTAAPTTVVTGEPHVDAPLIGTFTDDQAGTYADAAAGTEAIPDTATSPASSGPGGSVDAEELPASPIATGDVPASPSADQEVPMSALESDARNTRNAALASHDEALDEGVDAPHTLRTPSPLPAMNVPEAADESAPADSDPADLVTNAALDNDALDPLISEDAEEDPAPELPAPTGPPPADRA